MSQDYPRSLHKHQGTEKDENHIRNASSHEHYVSGFVSDILNPSIRRAMKGYIFQLNCSDGGVPKLPVAEADLNRMGLRGDRQAHPKIHGGPDRALCLYSLETIRQLQDEGHAIYPGSVGENLTISGLDWKSLAPGAKLAIGDQVLIEIVSYAIPCRTIKGSFTGGKVRRISQKVHPGEARLYARVLKTGRVATGEVVRVLNGEEG